MLINVLHLFISLIMVNFYKYPLILIFFIFSGIPNQINAQVNERSSLDSNKNTVWDLRLEDYLNKVDSSTPTITGGCVTLTSGAMASTLLLMALDLSEKKEIDSTRKELIRHIILNIKSKRDSLKIAADKDNDIFQNFLKAYKLPKSTKDESNYRKTTIHNLLIESTKSPLDAAFLIERLLYQIKESQNLINSRYSSDLRASTYMLNAAFDAIINIANDNISQLAESESEEFRLSRDLIIKREKLTFNKIMETEH